MSRRQKLRAEPFEPERRAIIERNFPYFALLSEDDKRELLGHVRVFLDEKKFEGCGGLELTDEIKLTIAAQACLLGPRPGPPDALFARAERVDATHEREVLAMLRP